MAHCALPGPRRTPRVEAIAMARAAVSDNIGVFEKIFEEHVSLCIWNREPDAALEHFFRERAGQDDSFTVRHRMGEDIESSIPPRMRRDPRCGVFALELQGLVDLFSTLTDAEEVGV